MVCARRWLVAVGLGVVAACGPETEDASGSGSTTCGSGCDDSSTGATATAADDGDATTTTTLGDGSSSESSSTLMPTTMADESSSSGEPEPSCACGPDEVCVQWETSHVCIGGGDYYLECVPRPPTCDGDAMCEQPWCMIDLCGQSQCTFEPCGQSDAAVVCGGVAPACNPYTQDCSDGEKCVPHDAGRDGEFEDSRCVPVDGTGTNGDPCTLESVASGVDDCDAATWCVDTVAGPDGLVGVCRPLCGGSVLLPTCPEGMTCEVTGAGYYAICQPD